MGAEQVGGVEPPPRFSAQRWAAIPARRPRTTVTVGGGRSPLAFGDFFAFSVNQTRITSYDQRSFIGFTPLPELSPISFEVLASVQGRNVGNDSLALTGAPKFLIELRAVERSWRGSARLIGTYDFNLTVSVVRPSVLWLSFSITDYITSIPHHDLPSMRHTLTAGFAVEEEPAHRLFSEFYELLSHPGSA